MVVTGVLQNLQYIENRSYYIQYLIYYILLQVPYSMTILTWSKGCNKNVTFYKRYILYMLQHALKVVAQPVDPLLCDNNEAQSS